MAKQTGIVSNLYLNERNISGDVGAINSISSSRAQLDVTGIDKEFMERLPGLGDGSISYTGFFNNALSHPELSAMSTAVAYVTCSFGTAIGVSSASLAGAQVNYDITRGNDGSLVWATEATSFAGYGVQWGQMLTNGQQSLASAGTTSSSADGGTATTNGGAAYLHAFSIGSGTATLVVLSSTDDVTFAAVSGGTFTAVTTGTAERISLSGTVNRYTRIQATGTFGTVSFAAAIHRD